MTFDEYQKKAIKTDVFIEKSKDINSPAFIVKVLGLVGETGEIAEKFKKIYRDNDGRMSKDQHENIKKELGDVLWYISALSEYLDISLNDIAITNIRKLEDRKKRDKLSGAGDNR